MIFGCELFGALAVRVRELVVAGDFSLGDLELVRQLREFILAPFESALPLAELVLLLVCTILGAFNDWNSVVRHHVYEYRVPSYSPEHSTIPVWMLLYWGMILRFVTSMSLWKRLRPPETPSNDVFLGPVVLRSPWRKIAVELLV